MDPLAQASYSHHKTESMKSPLSEGTGVQKETSVELKENLPVPEDILQDLSILINDEWLTVGKFLKIPEESLLKMHTDYGARQKEATYRMLLGWKDEMGKHATYGALAEALKKAGREDLADLSTELIGSQERLLVLEKILKGQKILLDLKKRGMSTQTSFYFSELYYDLREDIFLNMEEMFRCQERLIDFTQKPEMAKKIFFSSSESHDLQESLLFMKEILNCQRSLIDFTQKPEMAKTIFYSFSESHDVLKKFSLMKEIAKYQRSLTDLKTLELQTEKKPFPPWESLDHRRLSIMEEKLQRQQRLLDQEKRKLEMKKKPFLLLQSLVINEHPIVRSEDSSENKGVGKTENLTFSAQDQLALSCLRAHTFPTVEGLCPPYPSGAKVTDKSTNAKD